MMGKFSLGKLVHIQNFILHENKIDFFTNYKNKLLQLNLSDNHAGNIILFPFGFVYEGIR